MNLELVLNVLTQYTPPFRGPGVNILLYLNFVLFNFIQTVWK